jgi:hypothetical protein|tara:strand:- start:123 stop:644 length:522 start_codon:yes stop_codon:yes gene_type:complete
MEPNAMMVFTKESVEKLLSQGGSRSWKLNANRAQRYSYLICVRNNPGNKEGVQDNGQAFLIARIKDIVQSTDPQYRDRHMITFDQYAEIKKDDVWKGWRNPVYYDVSLNNLGIDMNEIKFSENTIETDEYDTPQSHESSKRDMSQGLTIEEAKEGLAKTFSVDVHAVEITIRG